MLGASVFVQYRDRANHKRRMFREKGISSAVGADGGSMQRES